MTRHPGAPLSDHEIKAVTDMMHDRIEEGVTMVERANPSGRNVYRFSRAFGLRAGGSPHRYFTWMRLDRARAVLARSDIDLSEIVYACGFSNEAHPKTAFGVTPGAYRAEAAG